jgi:DnaK suppressor protein
MLQKQLEEMLQALEQWDDGTGASRGPVELDQSSVGRLSRMDAMQMQAMALATRRRRLDQAHRIRVALQRLVEGAYGYCVNCGEPIAPARLDLDPAVPTFIACASGKRPA